MSIDSEERRSKLSHILFVIDHKATNRWANDLVKCADMIEALYVEKKPKFISIYKQYLCIKDFYMSGESGGERMFTKGNKYSSTQVTHRWVDGRSEGYFRNDAGDKKHLLTTDDIEKPFFDYFEEMPD